MKIFNSQEFNTAISDGKYILIDFFATWCMPCKMLSPILEPIATQFGDKMEFGKVDIDQSEDLARKYDVYSVPTLMLFKDGRKVDMLIGLNDAETIKKFLRRYVG